ncbi:hypothetical protein V5P93_003102 [Actinokineospora auranticolor]|uniref:Uncharacterized protein n=1 Tax=Actinokineospora auranticolor TaxID=155976 RepID=A0A2S6H1F0_9PSEU|nr:hypothetical protein [Actinokineospora auranticolor]PPK71237.1 hypothetical protein CLV40_101426 [Actinokineospora auranticolor]
MTDMAHPEDTDTGAAVTVALAGVARAAIAAAAPGELDYFDLVAVSWHDGGRRGVAGAAAGTVGSGAGPVVFSDVVFPLLTGAVAQVVGAAAFAGLRKRRWWRRRREPAAVAIRLDQVAAVRAACVAHGMTLGLSESEATLLADAINGALRAAAGGQPE